MRWVANFQQTGTTNELPQRRRPDESKETVDNVQVAFQCSLQKSIRRSSRKLSIPKTTLHKVLHKMLQLEDFKLQISQGLQPNNHSLRSEYAIVRPRCVRITIKQSQVKAKSAVHKMHFLIGWKTYSEHRYNIIIQHTFNYCLTNRRIQD